MIYILCERVTRNLYHFQFIYFIDIESFHEFSLRQSFFDF